MIGILGSCLYMLFWSTGRNGAAFGCGNKKAGSLALNDLVVVLFCSVKHLCLFHLYNFTYRQIMQRLGKMTKDFNVALVYKNIHSLGQPVVACKY